MSLSDADISRIIESIQPADGQAEAGETPGCTNEKTLVLVPSFVPAPERAVAAVLERYGESVRFVFLDGTQFDTGAFPASCLSWAAQKNELVRLLVQAENAVLLAPETGMLTRMGSGSDGEGAGEALLRRILWGKPVDILLDFEPPTFRRGTYFALLAEAINTLSSMGMRIFAYQPVESASGGVCSLVTEQDVMDAKRAGQKTIRCSKEAIVTPLAVDTAKELLIHIEYV